MAFAMMAFAIGSSCAPITQDKAPSKPQAEPPAIPQAESLATRWTALYEEMRANGLSHEKARDVADMLIEQELAKAQLKALERDEEIRQHCHRVATRKPSFGEGLLAEQECLWRNGIR